MTVIRGLYGLLPGPRPVRILVMALMAVVMLALVIWSYEILGDLLDTGGAIE